MTKTLDHYKSTAARLVPRGRRHRAQPRSPGEGGRHSDHYMTSLQDKQTEPIATVNLVELGKQAYQRQQINNGPSRSTFATGTEGLDTKQVGGSTERWQMPRLGAARRLGGPVAFRAASIYVDFATAASGARQPVA